MRGEMEAKFLLRCEIDKLTKKYERLGIAYENEHSYRENDYIQYRDSCF